MFAEGIGTTEWGDAVQKDELMQQSRGRHSRIEGWWIQQGRIKSARVEGKVLKTV